MSNLNIMTKLEFIQMQLDFHKFMERSYNGTAINEDGLINPEWERTYLSINYWENLYNKEREELEL